MSTRWCFTAHKRLYSATTFARRSLRLVFDPAFASLFSILIAFRKSARNCSGDGFCFSAVVCPSSWLGIPSKVMVKAWLDDVGWGKIGKTNMVLVHQSFSSYVKSDVMGCWNGCMHISPTGSFPSSGSTQHLHIVPRSHPKCRRKHLKFLSPQGKLSKKSRMFKVFQGPWPIPQKLHGFPTRKRVQRSRQSHQSCIRSWWTHQRIQQCAAWWPWYCLWREILFQCSLLNSNTLNAKTPWSAAQSQHWTEILQGFIQFSMNMAILVIRFWRVTWLLLPKIRPFFKIQTCPNFPQSLASVLCILWDVESTEWEPELLQVWLRHQGKCWLPTSFRIKAVQDIEFQGLCVGWNSKKGHESLTHKT